MKVRSGDLIDLLEFVMADGSVKNGGFSTQGGQEQPPFDLGPDEHIVRLEVKQGIYLDGLRIHTSKGRESQWYGGGGGEETEYVGSVENPIVGFERSNEAVCPKISRIERLEGRTEPNFNTDSNPGNLNVSVSDVKLFCVDTRCESCNADFFLLRSLYFQVLPALKVVQVRVKSGFMIGLIEFLMADGSVKNGGFSWSGGQQEPVFDLDSDEHIIKVETKTYKDNLLGIQFQSSKGKVSKWYGNVDGDLQEFVGSADNPIVGFERSQTGLYPRWSRALMLKDAVS